MTGNRPARRRLALGFSMAAIFLAVAAVLAIAELRNQSAKRTMMKQVSITLLGSTDQVTGINLPRDIRNARVSGADLLEPAVVTIVLPSGSSVSLPARSTSLISNSGRVVSVGVRGPLEQVRFQGAKAALTSVLARLRITPNEQMREELSLWTGDPPGIGEQPGTIPYDFKTGMDGVYPHVDLSVRISPDADGGWYYLLIFDGVTPEMQQLLRDTSRPTTRPATIP